MTIPRLDPVPAGAPRPRVSVVMPTYKRPRMIRETLLTVVNQAFTGMEILVKADGTEDGTEEEVRRMGDSRVRFSRSPVRLGMPGIRNALISETRGEYVLVLHDHDFFDKMLVDKMVKALDAHSGALYVHSAVEEVEDDKTLIRQYIGDFPHLSQGSDWLKYMLSRFDCPVSASSMVRRSAYERYGLYDSRYGFVSDVEMWMRLALYGEVIYIPEVLMSLRVREPTHEYRTTNWNLVDAILRIHEDYLGREKLNSSFYGRARFAWRAEHLRVISFLSSMKNTRFSRKALSEASGYFRKRGGIFTRILGQLTAFA